MNQQTYNNEPVENPLLKSSVKNFTFDNTTSNVINLMCSVCTKSSFSVTITGDSFFCYCVSCGASHQLSAYKAASTEKAVADLLVERHQPVVEFMGAVA